MRIRCISNTSLGLPIALERFGYRGANPLPLTVGKEYTVYAVALLSDQIWYFIENDDADALRYPSREPAQLFRVLEGSLPHCWEFVLTPDHGDHLALISFPEWTRDRFFYDKLTDGQDREIEIFKRRKKAIDIEASGLELVRSSDPEASTDTAVP
jgi:hypothetical protein